MILESHNRGRAGLRGRKLALISIWLAGELVFAIAVTLAMRRPVAHDYLSVPHQKYLCGELWKIYCLWNLDPLQTGRK